MESSLEKPGEDEKLGDNDKAQLSAAENIKALSDISQVRPGGGLPRMQCLTECSVFPFASTPPVPPSQS